MSDPILRPHFAHLLRPHECYRALGADEEGRQTAYRELFRYQLDPGLVDEIRMATNGNYALGSSHFQDQVARASGRRATRGRSGRPKKQVGTTTDDLFGADRRKSENRGLSLIILKLVNSKLDIS